MIMIFRDWKRMRQVSSFIDLLENVDVIDIFAEETSVFDEKHCLLDHFDIFTCYLLKMTMIRIFIEGPIVKLNVGSFHILR